MATGIVIVVGICVSIGVLIRIAFVAESVVESLYKLTHSMHVNFDALYKEISKINKED